MTERKSMEQVAEQLATAGNEHVVVAVSEMLDRAYRGSILSYEELGKQFDELLSDVLRVVNDRLFSARWDALRKGGEFDINATMYEMIEQAAAGTFIPGLHSAKE